MNQKIPKVTFYFAACLLCICAAFIPATFVGAQEPSSETGEQGGQAFAISPPLLELTADPGETVEAKLKFTNISSGPLEVKMEYNDFGARDETGVPNIIFDDQEETAHSLKGWITPQPQFQIASKETKTVTFPIEVPANAAPGGHYAVIRFTGISSGAGGDVAQRGSIGTLVLLRVSGEIKESAEVADFYAATSDFSKASIFENGPVVLAERIRNNGNIHIKPTGTVEVTDMFGNKVASLRVNGNPAEEKNQPRSILPDSIRRFDQVINNGWMFGRYEAKLNLSYGQDGNKSLVATTSFWVIPYTLVVIVIVALVALFFLLRFGIRKYNAHIISKSRFKK